MDEDTVFEVRTVLGVTVTLDVATWEDITRRKHRDLSGKLAAVQLTVSNPDEVRLSTTLPDAHIYYRVEGERQFVCVVTHRTGEATARVATAYSSNRVKRGAILWQR